MAGKSRSPNYPALSLQQALDLAGKLWAAEKRTAVSNDSAASAFGFKALSGPARVAIGALRQYGLIERTERGHVKLTDLAIHALHGTPKEREDALVAAATKPDLFNELLQTHREASEDAIRRHLLTKKGFADDGARKAAKAFRETIGLVSQPASGYNSNNVDQESESITMRVSQDQYGLGSSSQESGPTSGLLSLNVPYGDTQLSVQVKVSGERLKRAHIERVRKYLQLAEDDLESGQ
jgi:hypothetical protein